MLRALDLIVFASLNSFLNRSEWLDMTIFFLTSFFPFVIGVVFISVAMLAIHRRTHGPRGVAAPTIRERLMLLAGIVAPFLAAGLAFVVQHVVERARPYLVIPGATHLFPVDAYAFPSSHASVLFALAGAATRFNRNLGALLALAALIVGIARIVAGVHYPSDILAGAVLGYATGYGLSWLVEWRAHRRLAVPPLS